MTPTYDRDGITIYHADCREALGNMPDASADCIITDPPYDNRTHAGADKRYSPIAFAPLTETQSLVNEMLRVSARWVIAFCSLEMLGEYRLAAGDAWVRGGVWDRISNMPQLSGDRPAQGAEGIAIMHRRGKKHWNGGGRAAIFRHQVERGKKVHPTQKPLSLIGELVQLFSDPGDLVLDPFMGSGTTGVAARLINRRFVGIEISAEHVQSALLRVRQSVLFPTEPVA